MYLSVKRKARLTLKRP